MKLIKVLLFVVIAFSSLAKEAKDVRINISDEYANIEFIADDVLVNLATHRNDSYQGTLKEIEKRKFIRILTTEGDLNYFIRNGEEKGYEFWFISRFIDFLNEVEGYDASNEIKYEVIPVSREKLIPMLKAGKGDVIAAGMTITDNRESEVDFSLSTTTVNEVFVSNSARDITSIEQLAGKTVVVVKGSSYIETINQLNEKLSNPIKVKVVDGLTSLDVLEMINSRKVKNYSLTLVDSHLAGLAVKSFSNLSVKSFVPKKGAKLAWAVQKGSEDLLEKVNQFFYPQNYSATKGKFKAMGKGTQNGNMVLNYYFKKTNALSDLEKVKSDDRKISKFDEQFKTYTDQFSREYGIFNTDGNPLFDWRLISALVWRESKFNEKLKANPWGAIGLFQIKEPTAADLGFHDIVGEHNADNNIQAGISYLYWLYKYMLTEKNIKKYFKRKGVNIDHMNIEISDKDKVRFTLASYNAGPGKILKAMMVAHKIGLNPFKWFGNVEQSILHLKVKTSSHETKDYVSNINRLYNAYIENGF